MSLSVLHLYLAIHQAFVYDCLYRIPKKKLDNSGDYFSICAFQGIISAIKILLMPGTTVSGIQIKASTCFLTIHHFVVSHLKIQRIITLQAWSVIFSIQQNFLILSIFFIVLFQVNPKKREKFFIERISPLNGFFSFNSQIDSGFQICTFSKMLFNI